MFIYADNAATTKPSQAAVDAMVSCLNEVYGNPSSLHSMGKEAAKVLFEARQTIARCINCQPREIYFTSGGSESDNQAIRSAAHAGKKNNKLHIISTAIEHHAVLHTLDRLKTEGFEIQLLDVDQRGLVSPRQIADAIRKDTCLVTVMYANNEIGTILPIKEIGEICRKKGVVFHTDAVQAVGHIPVDVQKDNIDLLSLSGHKFHGPKGVGVLFARKGTALENLIDGGAQERGKRAGTENVPAIAGLGEAVRLSYENFDEKIAHMREMKAHLVEGLLSMEGVTVNGETGIMSAPHIVSVSFSDIKSQNLLNALSMEGIFVSSGSACTSNDHKQKHSATLTAIGVRRDLLDSTIRLSISDITTVKEIDYALEKLKEIIPMQRRFVRK